MANDRMMIRVKPELREKLKTLADKSNQTLSEYIRLQLTHIAEGDIPVKEKGVIQKSTSVVQYDSSVIQNDGFARFKKFKRHWY
jgi:antitoxin component of RelBE/YafQ-DinJ toxin-antitoxin module